jgi:molybdopterin/thiamine biosynthesis adenylyltransferase/rhodanese-related sulfurtransferase
MSEFNQELLRYSCQMQLPEFGEAKQSLLKQSKVLLVGAGGLGCPAAQYLAAAGVGMITIADFDTISVSNLHRQILYNPDQVGLKKAEVAATKLRLQNPQIAIHSFPEKITVENVMALVSAHDVIIDGTDNFETRYLLNDACVLAGKPLVYGAIYQYEGQLAVWNVQHDDGTFSPNYRDVFPEVDASLIPNCAEGGVIPTLAGIIGCMQANEAIKLLTNSKDVLAGKMLLLDAQSMQSHIIKTGPVSKVMISRLPDEKPAGLISAATLQEHLEDDTYELIDVRSEEERTAFNIGGKHIPIAALQDALENIDAKKPIVFYCASGKRSEQAVKLLQQKFPSTIAFSLEGGMKGWKEKIAARNVS